MTKAEDKYFPVGSRVCFWQWFSIDEGDTLEGVVEKIVGNYSWVNSGGVKYWVENKKMFNFTEEY